MSVPILNSPTRTLLAGTLMAASAVVLAVVGESIGVPEPWPVLLVAGAGLLVGIPRLQHGLALAVGATFGLFTTWLSAVVLPDVTAGTALATGVAVLFVTVVTVASSGRLRFGMQLVGWAAMTALAGPLVAPTGPAILRMGQLAGPYVAVLIASGLGLLVAQVAQLLATGVSARRGPKASPGPSGPSSVPPAPLPPAVLLPLIALGVSIAVLAVAPDVARADTVPVPTVQHRQLIIRTHSLDATPGRGVVVTRLDSVRTGEVSVALPDQAVTGLRNVGGFGAPDTNGQVVTYRLTDGVAVRTVADLDRALPVSISVAYRLDGQPIPPAALIGRSGRLEVTYTLVNRTTAARELRYFDASGRARLVTRDVAVPFAGTLQVTLDERLAGIRTDDGQVVTDRVGRRQLLADVVLFGPVGAPVQTVTWSADVRDAAVPAVQVVLLPVGATDLLGSGLDATRADVLAGALRDIAASGGLLRTGLGALGADTTVGLLAPLRAILEGQLETTALASADLNQARALLVAQEQRRRDGDGDLYGMLTDGRDLAAGVRADSAVVYVLDVAGSRADGGPAVPLRFGLAVVLLVAVGLLGQAVGALTGAVGDDRSARQER